MPGFTDLQTELLGYICTFMAPSDLAALALTAHAYNLEAERELYRDINLSCGHFDLVRSLNSLFVEGRRRNDHVRSLTVVLEGRPIRILADVINDIKNATVLSLYTSVPTPCEGVKSLPRNLRSLSIRWNFFLREQLFELLGTVPLLEDLSVWDWPQEEVEDNLPAGALPALRSICGSDYMMQALLPGRDTVTSVKIRSDYVTPPVLNALANKHILDLEVPFDRYSGVYWICAACPNLETLRLSGVVPGDICTWLGGRCPDGFRELKNLRALIINLDLMTCLYEPVAPGSDAALRDVLQPIWPQLETVTISGIPFSGFSGGFELDMDWFSEDQSMFA